MTRISLYCARLTFALVVVVTQSRGQTPLQVLAVTTATNFSAGWPAPGGLGVVFCRGLTGISGIVQAAGYPLPDTLAGVQLSLGDVAKAPLLAVADFGGYQQINFQVPWTLSGEVKSVSVSQGGVTSAAFAIPPIGWSPFFVDGKGVALAQHAADYRRVTRDDPARAGEWIIVYGSSMGSVTNPPLTGMPASAELLSPLGDSTIVPGLQSSTGPVTLEHNYVGLTPGAVGVWQVNLRVPESQPDGNIQLVMVRNKFCGFFFVQGCGRGFVSEASVSAALPVGGR